MKYKDLFAFSLQTNLYYISLFIYMVGSLLSYSPTINGAGSHRIQIVVSFLSLIFLLPNYLMKRYAAPVFFFFVTCGSILLISSYFSRSMQLLPLILFCVLPERVSFRRVAITACAAACTVLTIVISLSLFGVMKDPSILRANGLIRYSLGFNHPNTLAAIVLQILLCWVVIRWENFSFLDFMLMILISFLTVIVTNSRTTFIISLLVLFSLIIVRVKKNHLTAFTKFCLIVFPGVCAFFSFLLAVMYGPDHLWMRVINDLSSQRIFFSHEYLSSYGISWWGKPIVLGTNESFDGFQLGTTYTIDNAYCHLLVHYGLVATGFFITIYTIGIAKAVYEQNTPLIIIFCAYALLGLFETEFFLMPFNFGLVEIFVLIFAASSSKAVAP